MENKWQNEIQQRWNQLLLTGNQAVVDWEQVGLSNDFMFFHVFQDEKKTLELMRRIFPELDITAVRLHEQEVRKEDKEGKGIRIDLFAAGHSVMGEADYVVEMQTENTGDLGYRIRYYKSLVDLGSLRSGGSYLKLKKCFIVMICTFDMFGKHWRRYDFEERCIQDPKIRLENGVQTTILNTKGTQQPDMETETDVNPALTVKRADGEDITLKRGQLGEPLKNFLDYLNGKEITGDAFIDDLDRAVKEARKNTELRQEYMMMVMDKLVEYDRGEMRGTIRGKVLGAIEAYREMDMDESEIKARIMKKYGLDEKTAEDYMNGRVA